MIRSALVITLAFACVNAWSAVIVPSPPQIAAKAYLLVDADSGAVLAEHNADLPLPPASLTKMMTSYILAREITEGNVQLSGDSRGKLRVGIASEHHHSRGHDLRPLAGKNGWGGRIRTYECRDQNPVPCHLATPQ